MPAGRTLLVMIPVEADVPTAALVRLLDTTNK